MTSPNRSVIVRLAMDPTSYIAGASRAAAATTALDREAAKVGGTASTSMDRAAKSAAATEGAFGKLNKATSVLGVSFAGLAAAGGGIAAAMSVKAAADFQTSLTKLSTTAGESSRNLGAVGDGILKMAGDVGLSANELAKGMYTVESSGIHGANALIVLKAAAQGAVQEQADLGKVTDAVTTALHDYNLPATDAAKVTSQLVTAVSHGKTTFDELTGAMHSVTPLAAALHVPLADIAGTLSAMTASGESADQAAQNMADALRHLQSPTSTMTAELGQLGINAAELGPMLGQKGLAGTIQFISSAIIDHLDPATRQVLLPALNQSKTAVQDLQIMLGQMPPTLAKMSQGLLDGSVSVGEYRKAANDLGGVAGAMGLQFLGLVKTSQGFSNILKSGSPAAQEYTAALQKAMGTSAGLTVALQVTGEHAAATNAAIRDIAGAATQADGSIKGWSEVQGNFNQQLHEAEAAAGAMAIQFGQHLLPALTATLGFVNRDVLPGLKTMGSAADDAAHWFSELPTPIKDVAAALAAMALAEKVGLLNNFGRAAGGVGAAVQTMGMEMGTAFSQAKAAQIDTLFQSTRTFAVSGLGEVTARSALAESAVGKMSGTMAGFGAAVGRAAEGGLASMKSGLSGLMNMFGGPLGLSIAGAVVDITLIMQAEQAATEQEKKWADALKQGGKAADEASAAMARNRDQVEKLHSGFTGFATSVSSAFAPVDAMTPKADKAAKAFDDWYNSLKGVDRANEDVQLSAAKLNEQIDKYGPASAQAKTAAENYQGAIARQKAAQDDLNGAEQTHLEKLQAVANAELASVNSALAAAQAHSSFDQALQQLNADTSAGSLSQSQLNREQLALAQSAMSWAQAAGEAAAAQANSNDKTVIANASSRAQLDVLQQVAAQLGDATPAAIRQAIAALQAATVSTDDLSGAVRKLGLDSVNQSDQFKRDWGNNVQVLHGATAAQIKDLQDLGYTVLHLPNGNVIVSADTTKARQALAQLTNDYANYAINVGLKLGANSFAAADGGILPGNTPGRDVHHFTSPTAGSLHLSGGEAIMRPEFTDAVGPGWVHAMNKAARGGGTAGVRSALGFADGGVFPMYLTANAYISAATEKAALHAAEVETQKMLDAQRAAAGGGGAGNNTPFDGPENYQRALDWARTQIGKPYIWGGVGPAGYDCSGFMSSILNVIHGRSPYSRVGSTGSMPWPGGHSGTSGNFVIGSTPNWGGTGVGHMAGTLLGVPVESWGSHGPGVGSTSTGGALNSHFIVHEVFHQGGVVTGRPGTDVPAVLKVGETVRTPGQEEQLQARLTSREVGWGGGGWDYGKMAAAFADHGQGGRPMRIEGTLDLGNGLVGVVRGEIAAGLCAVTNTMMYSG